MIAQQRNGHAGHATQIGTHPTRPPERCLRCGLIAIDQHRNQLEATTTATDHAGSNVVVVMATITTASDREAVARLVSRMS
jgi:hypothetical protein